MQENQFLGKKLTENEFMKKFIRYDCSQKLTNRNDKFELKLDEKFIVFENRLEQGKEEINQKSIKPEFD